MSEDDETSHVQRFIEEPPSEAFESVSAPGWPKVLTTNEAMQTIGIGGLGLAGGGLLVVFGGVFVALGLVWAVAFSLLIVLLHRAEIASAWRARRFTSHLALPTAVVFAVPFLVVLVANKDAILAIGQSRPAAMMPAKQASAEDGKPVRGNTFAQTSSPAPTPAPNSHGGTATTLAPTPSPRSAPIAPQKPQQVDRSSVARPIVPTEGPRMKLAETPFELAIPTPDEPPPNTSSHEDRRAYYRKWLKRYYAYAGALESNLIGANKDEDIPSLEANFTAWYNNESAWVLQAMGPAALARFRTPSAGGDTPWPGDHAPDATNKRSGIIRTVKARMVNMDALMASDQWDPD
jgi:hypothetical protein